VHAILKHKIENNMSETKLNESITSRRKRNHTNIEFERTTDGQKQVQGDQVFKTSEEEIHGEMKRVSNTILLRLSQLDKIRKWRKENNTAPVDSMGAEALPQGTGKQFRYQTLVGLMLSSQTRDQMTAKAFHNLQENLPGGLTVESVRSCDDTELATLIHPVGFHVKKAGYLKKTAEILATKYDHDIPNNIKDLQSLPGVGPKMAHLAMLIAWNKAVGIGVDIHVHRICNRLGWVHTKTPEKTRLELESWLPKEHWLDVNFVLVGFGQTQCCPIKPKCATCVVNDTCPTGKDNLADETIIQPSAHKRKKS